MSNYGECTSAKPQVTIRETRDKVFTYYVAMELGIVPIEDVSADIRSALKDLDPETSWKMRRKFRKLWRRYYREEASRSKYAESYMRRWLGKGNENPTRAQKRNRKELVKRRLWKEFVKPAIDRFEDLATVKAAESD